MGGMNPADKLRVEGNVDAKKGTSIRVDVGDIYLPRIGPIAHPRADDPVDEDFLADILEKGEITEPIWVRRDGMYDGKMRLTLIVGSRRTNGLIRAIQVWEERGEMRPERRYIPIRFFDGSDKEALRFRLEENSRPLQKADRPSVLAKTAIQLRRERATTEEILLSMPRDRVRTLRDVENLFRWPSLVAEAAERFDSGAWPLGLLGPVLDSPRDGQVAEGDRLAAAGVRDQAGATRRRRREARSGSGDGPAVRLTQARVERVAARVEERVDMSADLACGRPFVLGLRFARGQVEVGALPDTLRVVVEEALAEVRPGRQKVAKKESST